MWTKWGAIEPDFLISLLPLIVIKAVDRGAPGVPFFYVNGQHFWGQDRLHFVEKALGNAQAQQFRALTRPKDRTPRKVSFYYDFSSPWA